MLISIPFYLADRHRDPADPAREDQPSASIPAPPASSSWSKSIVGIQTLKAAAVEPILRNQWEERLAAYVKTSFQAVSSRASGQNAIQYVSKATTALVLFFGAKAVIERRSDGRRARRLQHDHERR